jgi:hypothetical protein
MLGIDKFELVVIHLFYSTTVLNNSGQNDLTTIRRVIMKKIYITLLAIAAIGSSQVVLANDGDSQGNEWTGVTTSTTADKPVPTCDKKLLERCKVESETSGVKACFIVKNGCSETDWSQL